MLESWGSLLNPYNWCVANKSINGQQCTIIWHVGDLKISHMDPEVVTSMVNQLETAFAKEAQLTVTQGKVHKYLGMTLEFSIDRKVQIKRIDCIENM